MAIGHRMMVWVRRELLIKCVWAKLLAKILYHCSYHKEGRFFRLLVGKFCDRVR